MLKKLIKYGKRQRKWALILSLLEFLSVIIIGLVLYTFLSYWYQKKILVIPVLFVLCYCFVRIVFLFFLKKNGHYWSTAAKIEIKNHYVNGLFKNINPLLNNELEIIQADLKGLDKLDVVYEELFPTIFQMVLGGIFFSILSVIFHSSIATVIYVYFLLMIVSMKIRKKQSEKINRRHIRLFMQIGKRFYSDIEGLSTLMMYQQDDVYQKRFVEDSEKYRKSTMVSLSYNLRARFFLRCSLFLSLIIATLIINMEIKKRIFPIQIGGSFLGMIFYWFLSTQKIGYFNHIVKSARPIFDKIFSIIDNSRNTSNKVKFCEKVERIKINNLSFCYDGQSIITSCTAEFDIGTPYYVVGRNGAGKTTLVQLIMGIFPSVNGEIKWNNSDLKIIEQDSRFSKIGYLNSTPFLFEGSIADNIFLGDFKDKDLKLLSEKYDICKFVSNLVDGYETQVGPEGRFLSPGQKQQIAFARLFISNKDIYIFDEITSSVDKKTAQNMMSAINDLAKESIVIIITHQLESIPKDAQVIFVNQKQIFKGENLVLYENNVEYKSFLIQDR